MKILTGASEVSLDDCQTHQRVRILSEAVSDRNSLDAWDKSMSTQQPYQFGLGSLLLFVTFSALFLAASRTLYLFASPGVFVLWVIGVGGPLIAMLLSGLALLCSFVFDSLLPETEDAPEERLPTSKLNVNPDQGQANIDHPQTPPLDKPGG
jgi:hypothetical protein